MLHSRNGIKIGRAAAAAMTPTEEFKARIQEKSSNQFAARAEKNRHVRYTHVTCVCVRRVRRSLRIHLTSDKRHTTAACKFLIVSLSLERVEREGEGEEKTGAMCEIKRCRRFLCSKRGGTKDTQGE